MTGTSRWISLVAATLVLVCTGSLYAFSVLSGPLAALHGWSLPDVALGFTLNTAITPIPMILGGKIVDKGWARQGMALGAVLFGLAFILTALTTSLILFYIGYGIVGGLGAGLAYSGALGNTTRFFPDRRGLATGVLMAGNGAAALITAPLASALISGGGIRHAWLVLGVGFVGVALLCGLVSRSAPVGYALEGWTPQHTPNVKAAGSDLSWSQMIRRPAFYLLLFILAAGALSGLMIAANASQIGEKMFGLSAAQSALYVGLYSAGSAGGRFTWGVVSDRIGRPLAIVCIFGLVAVMLLTLALTWSLFGFAIGIIGIGLSFGGLMGVFPPLIAERFGAKHFGVNYGVLFTGYSIAAFFGPRIGASIGASHHGNFKGAFAFALIICLAGTAGALAFLRIGRSRSRPADTVGPATSLPLRKSDQ